MDIPAARLLKLLKIKWINVLLRLLRERESGGTCLSCVFDIAVVHRRYEKEKMITTDILLNNILLYHKLSWNIPKSRNVGPFSCCSHPRPAFVLSLLQCTHLYSIPRIPALCLEFLAGNTSHSSKGFMVGEHVFFSLQLFSYVIPCHVSYHNGWGCPA